MIPRMNKLMWMALIVAAATGLYMVKYRVQTIQAEIADVTRQLEEERENLHVAAAEWAYLNKPERLQQLSSRHLKLQPMKIQQIADVGAVPTKTELAASARVTGVTQASLIPAEGE